jgi:hypothetical protein
MFFNALPVPNRRLYQNSSNQTSFFNGAVSIDMSHTDFWGDPVLAAPEKEEDGHDNRLHEPSSNVRLLARLSVSVPPMPESGVPPPSSADTPWIPSDRDPVRSLAPGRAARAPWPVAGSCDETPPCRSPQKPQTTVTGFSNVPIPEIVMRTRSPSASVNESGGTIPAPVSSIAPRGKTCDRNRYSTSSPKLRLI